MYDRACELGVRARVCMCVCESVCMCVQNMNLVGVFVRVFRSHQKSQGHEILALEARRHLGQLKT